MSQKMEAFKHQKQEDKARKQQELFKAEQKRADMKTALYHMAVWNVQEAGDLIKEIIYEADNNGRATTNGTMVGGNTSTAGALGPKSVAEKVREKAAILRRNERRGIKSSGGMGDMMGEPMGFGHYENGGNNRYSPTDYQSNDLAQN